MPREPFSRGVGVRNAPETESFPVSEVMPVLEARSTVPSLKKSGDAPQDDLQATIQALRRANYHNDQLTDQHCERIGACARMLGSELGLDQASCERLKVAASLHDIGKIGLPDRILNKPGPLTPDERLKAQTHCTIGYEILSQGTHSTLRMAADIALHHHERWDGHGYPHQLASTDISWPARIVAVIDVFDALCTHRPYKTPWTKDEVFSELNRGSGTAFDPEVVAAFTQLRPRVLSLHRSLEASLG